MRVLLCVQAQNAGQALATAAQLAKQAADEVSCSLLQQPFDDFLSG
jgi:hypothetical protein